MTPNFRLKLAARGKSVADLASAFARRSLAGALQEAIQEVEVATAGATVNFKPSACGRVMTFTGRVLFRSNDGAVRPVPDALFWYDTPPAARVQIDVMVDAQGSFGGTIWTTTSGFGFLAKEGEVLVQTDAEQFPVAITAEGCLEGHVGYDDEWQPQDVFLDCHHR